MFRTEARGYTPFSIQPKANFSRHRSLLEKILRGIVSILFVTFFLKSLDGFDGLDGARTAYSRLHKRDVSEEAIPAFLEDLPQEPSEADNDESKAIQKPQSSADDAPEICYSEGCIHTASKLLSNMNQSVDPCQDFYRFTCGRFLEESVIPDDKPELSSFSVIRDQLKLQIRTIIEEPAKDSDIKPFRLAKNFYKVCMNETQIELQGLDHMKSILKQLGGWPVLEVDIAVFMGADREAAVKELRESRDFEIALANISSPETERRNATKLYNPMKITELQERYPSIPWTEYINTILSPNAQLKDDETIIVMEPEYIHDLEKLLSTTPKRTMANYVMWRATADSVSYLTEAIRARQSAYIKAVTGVSEQQARWKDCVDAVKASFPLAIGSLYVRKYFKEAAKSNAVEMVQLMREEMYKIISSVDWMDEVTRQAALDKAKFMTPYIAYPEEFLINAKLEEYYSGLEVEPTNFLEAGLNLTRFGVNYAISQLRKPVNKTDWITHGKTTEVNAFYALNENSIQLPAGILQGIFFSNDRPKYMNYGTMGFVIGHEITHGFDDQGRQYDKDGNLVDWWAESTKEKFLKKVECIIEQYGNYSVPEVNMTLNGINTQGENIADNGGIKEAYNAYNVWTGEHGEEPRLPGLQQYSPRQMFWISAASTW
ncbi:neprilysin-2-like [Diaphorina citri]|uniref:Neprilysin-2-like n=1 Tax=Diaphorina citri TaxID=121845 RepID=A0A1S3DE08_DIACI|nr:neprilysin-2-like [Diaphorina citri]